MLDIVVQGFSDFFWHLGWCLYYLGIVAAVAGATVVLFFLSSLIAEIIREWR